jgi:DNA polymerase I-like protein with 3'-5' exonuclease and polymerase domains
LYGSSTQALAEELGWTLQEAEIQRNRLMRTFPGLQSLQKRVQRFCKDKGFSMTLFGRRRWLPNIHSEDTSKRNQARRQAFNSTCQGSAADLLKVALQRVHEEVVRINEEFDDTVVRLLLSIHDEVLLEVRKDALRRVLPAVKSIMQSVLEGALRVALVVKARSGRLWSAIS